MGVDPSYGTTGPSKRDTRKRGLKKGVFDTPMTSQGFLGYLVVLLEQFVGCIR